MDTLRMKDGIYEDTVRTCATICAEECERIVDFCVNDDLEAAVTCGATACHLGKNDMPLDIAWEVLRDKLDSMPSSISGLRRILLRIPAGRRTRRLVYRTRAVSLYGYQEEFESHLRLGWLS